MRQRCTLCRELSKEYCGHDLLHRVWQDFARGIPGIKTRQGRAWEEPYSRHRACIIKSPLLIVRNQLRSYMAALYKLIIPQYRHQVLARLFGDQQSLLSRYPVLL